MDDDGVGGAGMSGGGGAGGGDDDIDGTINFSMVHTWFSISANGSFGYLKLLSVPATDCMSKLVSISIDISAMAMAKIVRVSANPTQNETHQKQFFNF